jgi:hypothetical protein
VARRRQARYAAYHTRIDWRWLTLELATLVAAAVALWRLRYPFLMMPVAFTLWYMSMDLARLIVAPHRRRGLDLLPRLLVFLRPADGAVRVLGRRPQPRPQGSGRDYAFWPYLLGMLTFWCALTLRRSDSEWTSCSTRC